MHSCHFGRHSSKMATGIGVPGHVVLNGDAIPIGVFWDIENCNVPHGKSALGLVQAVRQRFFTGHREVEFMCVCDTSKERREIIEELNYAQVTVVHINATSKNAADDKLRQSLHRFANTYPPPASVLLISGDVNFAAELSDLRYRHHLTIILVHPLHTQEALLCCAHETMIYDDLVTNIPFRNTKAIGEQLEVLVGGLPNDRDFRLLQRRLNQLSSNCGGRVVAMKAPHAILKFPSAESTRRASVRLDGEDVFGSALMVESPSADSFARIKQGMRKQGIVYDISYARSSSLSPAKLPEGRTHSPTDCNEGINTGECSPPSPKEIISNRKRKRMLQKASRQDDVKLKSDQSDRRPQYSRSRSVPNSNLPISQSPQRDSRRKKQVSYSKESCQQPAIQTVHSPLYTETKIYWNQNRNHSPSSRSDRVAHPLCNKCRSPGVKSPNIHEKRTYVVVNQKCKAQRDQSQSPHPRQWKRSSSQVPIVSDVLSNNLQQVSPTNVAPNEVKVQKSIIKPQSAVNTNVNNDVATSVAQKMPHCASNKSTTEQSSKELKSPKKQKVDVVYGKDEQSDSQSSSHVVHSSAKSDTVVLPSLEPGQQDGKIKGGKKTEKKNEPRLKLEVIPQKMMKPRPIKAKQPSPAKYSYFSGPYHPEPFPSYVALPSSRKFVGNKPHAGPVNFKNFASHHPQQTTNYFAYGEYDEDEDCERDRVLDAREVEEDGGGMGAREGGDLGRYSHRDWQSEGMVDEVFDEQVDGDVIVEESGRDLYPPQPHYSSQWAHHYWYSEQYAAASNANYPHPYPPGGNYGYSREQCRSAPAAMWGGPYHPGSTSKQISPSPHKPEFQRRSPNFRRTPGASRPSSRSSIGSLGSARPYSTASYHSPSPCFSDQAGNMPPQGAEAECDHYFQPIPRNSSPLLTKSDLQSSSQPQSPLVNDGASYEGSVEVTVSNLDYNISAREWQQILFSHFQQHVQVLSVHIQTQPGNTNVGFVRVPTEEEARIAISHFHRKKIGYKRIHVALVNQDPAATSSNMRSEVVALLKEVTECRLPLFKFIELFEKRYHHSISVSELYRMKETVDVEEQEGTGRTVVLREVWGGDSPNPNMTLPQSHTDIPDRSGMDRLEDLEHGDGLQEEACEVEPVVCRIHCTEDSPGYIEALDSCSLPHVTIQLKMFAARVHTLLQAHDGAMPLMSFPACYMAEFVSLPTVPHGGVPLEHLITCVPGVHILLSRYGIKKIQWAENKPPPVIEFGRFCPSPMMNQQLSQIAREIIDLLKHAPGCRMPFTKFIPAYHHHFGRKCRVADYGYTKLMELFEAIPHVVQVIGSGNRRYVTLTHRMQVRRFGTDLLRVLKSQASKQISVLDLCIVYHKVCGKPFDITEYGICYIEDILCELPDSSIQVTGNGEKMVLSIPKRDQTANEIERTKQFALEVVDLLKHSPQSRMPFNKFIPAYHHHFGKQCRVSDYGFTKLVELLEAIPHVLKIMDEQEEKTLCLTETELLKVLEEQVCALLRSCPNQEVAMPEFLVAYMKFHGHSLRLPDYGASSVVELVEKIPRVAKVDSREGRYVITLLDHSALQQLAHRVLLILMDQQDGALSLEDLSQRYLEIFSENLTTRQLEDDLENIVQVNRTGDEVNVKLCSLQLFARDVRTLLRSHQGRLGLGQFDTAYAEHFGVGLVPASYGYPSTAALLQAIPHVANIRGRGFRRTVLLCQDFQGKLNPLTMTPPKVFQGGATSDSKPQIPQFAFDPAAYSCNGECDGEVDLLTLTRHPSPYDLLGGCVPSNVPSPELHPVHHFPPPDLMCFTPSTPGLHGFSHELLTSMTDEEKNGQKTPLCKTPVSDMLQFAAQLLPHHRVPTDPHSTTIHSSASNKQISDNAPLHPTCHGATPLSMLQYTQLQNLSNEHDLHRSISYRNLHHDPNIHGPGSSLSAAATPFVPQHPGMEGLNTEVLPPNLLVHNHCPVDVPSYHPHSPYLHVTNSYPGTSSYLTRPPPPTIPPPVPTSAPTVAALEQTSHKALSRSSPVYPAAPWRDAEMASHRQYSDVLRHGLQHDECPRRILQRPQTAPPIVTADCVKSIEHSQVSAASSVAPRLPGSYPVATSPAPGTEAHLDGGMRPTHGSATGHYSNVMTKSKQGISKEPRLLTPDDLVASSSLRNQEPATDNDPRSHRYKSTREHASPAGVTKMGLRAPSQSTPHPSWWIQLPKRAYAKSQPPCDLPNSPTLSLGGSSADSSVNSSPSHRGSTPRKSRIAAKFNIPISPDGADSTGTV